MNCNKLKWFFCDSFSVQAVGISEFKQKGTSTYKTWQDQVINFHKNSNLEFFTTATVLVNENQIFNDNIYEFEELGIPFLAALGREILTELNQ